MAPRYTYLTNEERSKIKELYNQNVCPYQIAKSVNRSNSAVKTALGKEPTLRSLGKDLRIKVTPDMVEQMKELHKDLSYSDIAKRFNIHYTTVRYHLDPIFQQKERARRNELAAKKWRTDKAACIAQSVAQRQRRLKLIKEAQQNDTPTSFDR